MLKTILFIIGGLAVLLIIWRILVRWSIAGSSLLDQAKGAVSFLNACIKSVFGGRDVRC